MKTPVVLVTGIDDSAMASVTINLQFDLPHAVVMRHTLDVETQRLTRMVSDIVGVVEHTYHDLEHACVNCALREDIVPTLERLASSGRWGAIIAHLPVAAEAQQVCRVIAMDRRIAPHLRISAVISAVDGPGAFQDLLGDDLLAERGLHTSEDDTRGVAEAHAALVEYADAVVIAGEIAERDHDLVRALARPDALVVPDASRLDTPRLLTGMHDHARTERWVDVVRRGPVPLDASPHVWTMDLTSSRPFHPGRLLDCIEVLGGGPHRTRGCFWVPTRPGDVCVWDGAGGQLSIGADSPWGRMSPITRIVTTGVADADHRDDLAEAFEHCVLSDAEVAASGMYWEAASDGLEPWLGEIRRVA